jgi:hypothetical protein
VAPAAVEATQAAPGGTDGSVESREGRWGN